MSSYPEHLSALLLNQMFLLLAEQNKGIDRADPTKISELATGLEVIASAIGCLDECGLAELDSERMQLHMDKLFLTSREL